MKDALPRSASRSVSSRLVGLARRARSPSTSAPTPTRTSKGIYRFTLDPKTGATTAPVLAGEAKNPSFLALHPNGRFLYAVGEMDELRRGQDGRRGERVRGRPEDGRPEAAQPAGLRGHGPVPPGRRRGGEERARRQLRRRQPWPCCRSAPDGRLAAGVVGARRTRARGRTRGARRSRTRTASTSSADQRYALLARPRRRPRVRLPLRRREGHARPARRGRARPRARDRGTSRSTRRGRTPT